MASWMVVGYGVDPSTSGFSDRQFQCPDLGRWMRESAGSPHDGGQRDPTTRRATSTHRLAHSTALMAFDSGTSSGSYSVVVFIGSRRCKSLAS
jgi:hypothetical protein